MPVIVYLKMNTELAEAKKWAVGPEMFNSNHMITQLAFLQESGYSPGCRLPSERNSCLV
jgi:hypothetical protein